MQLVNRIRSSNYVTATLEQDRFKLDGSMSFPDDVLANNGEVGFVSNAICDSTRTFASPPSITLQFGSVHSSAGITVTFDQITGEYATDFKIDAYNTTNALITSVTITGNTSVIPQPIGQLLNYKKLVITINKWSVANRRARVMEIDFGIVKVYTDDNLIRMGLTEELDLSSGTLPSAEFRFTVDNSDRSFNILSPTGFYKYLQQRQKITSEIGIELENGSIEYVPLGTYALSEWISDEGALTASFTARTLLDTMAGFVYENYTTYNMSLYNLAVTVFSLCGIPVTSYYIDSALASIMTNSIVEKANMKDVLQMIAIAGCANIWVDRDSKISLVCMPAAIGPTQDVILGDNAYAEPQVTLERITKQVDVTYWTNKDTSAGVTVTAAGVTDGDLLTIEKNKLINTLARAIAVGNWILQQRSRRTRYATNWRGNPAYSLGDVVEIENSYGANMKSIVTKNDITYEGYLQVKTESKGVSN